MKKVLVVAAHPDDEVLGCGGAMAKHVSQGDSVKVLIMAEGLTSRDQSRNSEIHSEGLNELRETAKKANARLGVTDCEFAGLPDNRLDSIDVLDVIKLVEKVVNIFQPEIVYTHLPNDLNVDHRVVNQAVLTACRPQPGFPVRKILCFEVSSSTDWQIPNLHNCHPNYFVDITNFLDSKLLALEEYSGEMRPWPHSRSIKAIDYLAKSRGASVGVEAAEAFYLARYIDCVSMT